MNATMAFSSTSNLYMNDNSYSDNHSVASSGRVSRTSSGSSTFRRGSGNKSNRGFLGQKAWGERSRTSQTSQSKRRASTGSHHGKSSSSGESRQRRSTLSKPLINTAALVSTEILLEDLQDGDFTSCRSLFAQLRFHAQERRKNVEQLAQAYSASVNNNSTADLSLETLQQWTRDEPDNRDAHLIYGIFLVTSAWAALRTKTSMDEETKFTLFQNQLNKAETALQLALDLDPTDPLPYANILTASRELTKLNSTFQKFQMHAKKEDRHDLAVHEAMLYRLSPTWGGSVEELLEFARHSTIYADVPPPAGHALWTILARAHLLAYKWHLQQPKDSNISSSAHSKEYWKDATVRKEIVKAYRKQQASSSKSMMKLNNSMSASARSNVGAGTSDSDDEDTDDKTKDALARNHTNLFAYCLYKCKAFSEAYAEFVKINNKPLQEPWNLESKKNWKDFFQHAQDKVLQRKAVKRQEKALWDSLAAPVGEGMYYHHHHGNNNNDPTSVMAAGN